MRTVNVTRYVMPLREGGSLPAIVEADDDGLYVLKFRGAELIDETQSLTEAGIIPNGTVIMLSRHRRPVK